MLSNRTILSISPFIVRPFIHGSVTRVYYINRELAKNNKLIFVHRFDEKARPVDFPAVSVTNGHSRIRQIFSAKLLKQAGTLISQHNVDLIIANHIWAGLHGILLSKWKRVSLIFDNHNIEYTRFKRMKSPIWPLIWLLEKLICSMAQEILCVSQIDRAGLIKSFKLKPNKVQVIENGVSLTEINNHRPTLTPAQNEQLQIIYFGSFSYPPNAQAAQILVQQIKPRLEKQGLEGSIIIIGSGPKPVVDDDTGLIKVKTLGFVDDLFTYIKQANIMLAPLMAGSGTRFKILETIACQTPVITTTIGAEGIEADVCGPYLHICDDWDNFAEMTVKVLKSPVGLLPATFAETYDWPNIVKKIDFPE